MSADRFCVLILEDDPVTLRLVMHHLQQEFPYLQLLPARTIEQAKVLSEALEIDCCLSDVWLPDGNGVDFLSTLMERFPRLEAIIMSADKFPDSFKEPEWLGLVTFLSKPIDLEKMTHSLASCLQRKTATKQKEKYFKAFLSRLTIIDILQMKCSSRGTQILQFHLPDNSHGSIYLHEGQIVHAEFGEQQGLDAFYHLLTYEGGEVEELPYNPKAPTSIEGNWQKLLMEATQHLDEQRQQKKQDPPPIEFTELEPNEKETFPPSVVQEFAIVDQEGHLRVYYGLKEEEAQQRIALIQGLTQELRVIENELGQGTLLKLEIEGENFASFVQQDYKSSILSIGCPHSLQNNLLMKETILLVQELVEVQGQSV